MKEDGFSLIESLISIAIVIIIFGGIYLSYSSILDSITNASLRAAAVGALNRQIEVIRNLPYDSVGTVSGIPSGAIPQTQNMVNGGVNFTIKTTIRNIDDPFDGTLGGSPNDTTPADYKLAEVEVTCPQCKHFIPIALTATVAPKNLESAGNNGSLFVNVFDASGGPIQGVTVNVVNTSTTPTIGVTDITNNSGMLQLVGVPTSTQSYNISVSKTGYSSDRTYPKGAAGNPNPIKPYATVAAGTLTTLSFAIDRVSPTTVISSDAQCTAIPSVSFSMVGAKLIGTNPTVLKFSTTSVTSATGTAFFPNIEWDTYTFTMNSNYDLAGTIPFSPLIINPNTNVNFRFVLTPRNSNALLVSVKDATSGGPVYRASVTATKGGFSQTLIAGERSVTQSDWSGNQYSSANDVDADSSPGSVTLVLNGGVYSTTTVGTLISNTIDVGSSTSHFYSFDWSPSSQPAQTGSDSIRFQVAANNNDTTWNFVGSDGTAGSYFTNSHTVFSGQFDNNRYFRYKVFLQTADENFTPTLQDATVTFNSGCVPPSQVLFQGLTSGTYSLTVTSSSYVNATSSVTVSSTWQGVVVPIMSL